MATEATSESSDNQSMIGGISPNLPQLKKIFIRVRAGATALNNYGSRQIINKECQCQW